MKNVGLRKAGLRSVPVILAALVAVAIPSTAYAAIWTYQALGTGGTQAPRSVWLNYDTDYRRARAYSQIYDAANGDELNVATNQLRLLRWTGSSWVIVASNADEDGYNPSQDDAQTGLYNCASGTMLRVQAYFAWTGGQTGGTWLSSANNFQCP